MQKIEKECSKKTVGANLQKDSVSVLTKLSEDFYREVQLTKECACRNDPTGAGVHRLMAECLHDMSLKQ